MVSLHVMFVYVYTYTPVKKKLMKKINIILLSPNTHCMFLHRLQPTMWKVSIMMALTFKSNVCRYDSVFFYTHAYFIHSQILLIQEFSGIFILTSVPFNFRLIISYQQ